MHNLDDQPKCIKIYIFSFLKLRDLLNLRLLNKYYSDFVKKNKWNHLIIGLKNINNIQHVIETFSFNNYDFSFTKITDESVKMLGQCHTLNLSWTNITDESVKMLGNCHTLNLSFTKITDESVKMLGNCHTLGLVWTNITDESVKMLGNCHTLHLNCTKITKNIKQLLPNTRIYM